MVTRAGTQDNLVDALNSLIELDLDAVEAYRAAIARVQRSSDKTDLASFMADHDRHVRDLTAHVQRLGGTAKTQADAKQILTKGKVLIAGLVGDRAVFFAMRTNEDDTNTAYENINKRNDLDDSLREVLLKNLDDEKRHRAWLVQRIESEREIRPQA